MTLGRNEVFEADFVTVVQQSFIHPTRTRTSTSRRAARERHVERVVGVDHDSYVQERHLAPSPDGTSVPVVIVRRRDVGLDGTAPLYLYGYGSYEACLDPDFGLDWWRSLPSLLDRGVVCAFGQPRGGGEMGRRWWLDGHLRAKPNTFDDQAAVADHLAGGLVDGTRIVTEGFRRGACSRARSTHVGPNGSPAWSPRSRSSTWSPPWRIHRCRSPSPSGTSGEILPTPATAP